MKEKTIQWGVKHTNTPKMVESREFMCEKYIIYFLNWPVQ